MHAALHELDSKSHGGSDRGRLELRCKTLITLALAEFLTSGLTAATGRLTEASVVVEELDDADLRARLEYQRANIMGRAGHLAAAWKGLEGAVERLSAFNPREQCSVHLSKGMLAFELGKPREAVTSFDEAIRIARAHGYRQQERLAMHNKGYVTYLAGDIPRSLHVMAEADAILGDVSQAGEHLDKARVLLEAGLVSDAVDALLTGIHQAPNEGNEQLRAEFDLELARAYRLMGRLDLAAAAAASSRAGYLRIGAEAWTTRATLIELSIDLDRQRRAPRELPTTRAGSVQLDVHAGNETEAASVIADRMVRQAEELGHPELADQARVVAGEARLLMGDVSGARERLLVPRRSAPGSLADELNTAAVTAAMHVAAAEPTLARRLLSSAVKRLAAGQQGSASLDLRTARAVHGVRLAAIDLDLAVPRGSGAVLETLERWRSATDHLPSLDRSVDARLADLTEALRSARTQQRTEVDPVASFELQRRATGLEQQIRARDWALSSRSDAAAAVPVRVREARQALVGADRDLLWLFAYRGRLCGVGVIDGRSRLRDLIDLAEVIELARRIRLDLRAAATQQAGPLTAMVWRSLESDAARLDNAVIRPWRARQEGLVLVTTPEVSALPWALCPSLVGRPLTIARSLTSFARRSLATSEAGPLRDPTSQQGDSTPWNSVQVSIGPGLARAAGEGTAVEAAWRRTGTAVTLANPSTRVGLVQALTARRVVHVAAHGTHQTQSPLFSSLALHDGPVFAHELQPTGVAAEHVVLSACDVGSATFRPGDEQLGLAASIFSLGAGSVVAATAPIPDDVAAAVMTAHHESLARGAASDEALALAIASTDPVAAAFLNLGGRFVP
ncbi:MAG: CHAT domain-containing protein [Terracoccus sp.]